MAKLDFNPDGYQYDQGLKAIKLMWVAASQALESRESEVLREIEDYWKHVESGGEPIGEWDGPDRLWDHADELRLEMLALTEAGAELNRATAIAIYHHWERHVPNESKERNRNHRTLTSALKKADIDVHSDLDALYYATNFLKHGNQTWLQKLEVKFSAKFPNLRNIEPNFPAWWSKLSLDKLHVEWFFEIAKASKRPFFLEL